eukprot:139640-Pyramimonas_sp.AAC.1
MLPGRMGAQEGRWSGAEEGRSEKGTTLARRGGLQQGARPRARWAAGRTGLPRLTNKLANKCVFGQTYPHATHSLITQ